MALRVKTSSPEVPLSSRWAGASWTVSWGGSPSRSRYSREIDEYEAHGGYQSLRKALGMTQADMAAALGMTSVFIGMMERGERPIEPRTRRPRCHG